jgi:hypothetical protein
MHQESWKLLEKAHGVHFRKGRSSEFSQHFSPIKEARKAKCGFPQPDGIGVVRRFIKVIHGPVPTNRQTSSEKSKWALKMSKPLIPGVSLTARRSLADESLD